MQVEKREVNNEKGGRESAVKPKTQAARGQKPKSLEKQNESLAQAGLKAQGPPKDMGSADLKEPPGPPGCAPPAPRAARRPLSRERLRPRTPWARGRPGGLTPRRGRWRQSLSPAAARISLKVDQLRVALIPKRELAGKPCHARQVRIHQ